MVARRWQSLKFRAETYVEFSPKTYQQFAGLVNYYSIKNWTSIHVTMNEEKGRILDILSCDQFKLKNELEGREIEIPTSLSGVYLAVDVDGLSYNYSYSFDGINWNKIEIQFESIKLSDDYVESGGFFTGAFVGVHAVDLTGQKLHADFDYFSYVEE